MLRDFRTFARLIAAHFAAMSVHELFRVDISGDHLWQSYLDAFPPGVISSAGLLKPGYSATPTCPKKGCRPPA